MTSMYHVLVSSLNVECSLKVINLKEPNTAMSDCCRLPAEFVALFGDAQMFRCYDHRGQETLRKAAEGYSTHMTKAI